MGVKVEFFFDYLSPYAYLANTQLWDRAAVPEIGQAIERDIGEAVERGIFGAPTIFVDDEMFFGDDRLDFVRGRIAVASDARGEGK